MTPMARYVFITGGVVSSLGKGIAAAALGALLQARGYRARIKKLDPYLNVDPGTMSPYQHGEVFVTDDGAETDLDLGHYERFTGRSANQQDNITTGRIYKNIIERERRGDYLGATVQVIPHVTDEIKHFVLDGNDDYDFVLCELFCNVRESAVIQALDVPHIYDVPLAYHQEGLDSEVLAAFGIDPAPKPRMEPWQKLSNHIHNPEGEVTIAIVGKYTGLKDAYKSLIEALSHGGLANRVKVKLDWIESEIFEKEDPAPWLEKVHGILVPGGFGERGSEGKILAAKFARERKVPYFGICFGMQMACIEAARSLAGVDHASSTEFGPTDEPVVGLMTEWLKGNMLEKRRVTGDLGGTMRLGAYQAELAKGSKIADIYGDTQISERHRHRYEVNIDYKQRLEDCGLVFAGMSPDGVLPETVEYPDHPWFIGVQYHPELKSRPLDPHPLFASFISAAVDQSRLV